MRYNLISNEDRERIVDSYINGSCPRLIAKVMGFKRRTVHNIIKKYLDGGDYRRQQKQKKAELDPRKRIVDSKSEIIQAWVDEDCTISLNTMTKKLKDEKNIDLGITGIHRRMKDFNYSFKRISSADQNSGSNHHKKKSTDESNDLVAQKSDFSTLEMRAFYVGIFVSEIARLDDSKVFFINEATFCITTRTKYKKEDIINKKFPVTGPGFNTKNILLCCAMNKHAIVEHQTQLHSFDEESFHQFIQVVILKFTQINITEATIIMDSVFVDNNPSIRRLIGASGHRLICLPPNSLFLNPTESIYTKWKQLIREKDPQNERELFETVNNVWSEITNADCKSFYEHMLSFIPKCLQRMEIIDE